MTITIRANQVLDCKGLACPMPIVKTKKAIESMAPGEVIEMQSTDKGSLADIQSWAKNTGHQYLGSLQNESVWKHYIRKATQEEAKVEIPFPYVTTNEQLQNKLEIGEQIQILDVREPAEYAFHHIPGAYSIPFGDLKSRLKELNPNSEIHVICRTGNRSDYACQLLKENGFTHVINVVPGMTDWAGATESISS